MEGVAERVLKLLEEYPLCDSCLGRMFALLGRGLSNAERGRALKLIAVMELHRRIREGDEEARALFRRLAPRLGRVAAGLYRELFGEEPGLEACHICGGSLEDRVAYAGRDAVNRLRYVDVSSFLVAARIPDDVRAREDEVKLRHGLQYSESIGAEVRREVSKRVQAELALTPDFEAPDVLVEVDLGTWTTRLEFMPLLIRGRYWKTARRVSQSIWVTRRGERRYPFSVEDGLSRLADIYEANDVVLHGAGREDADVRMLGTGRPFIAEAKAAKRRGVSVRAAEAEINRGSRGLVEFRLEGRARRKDVAGVKGVDSRHGKVYKALVVLDRDVGDDDLARLEEFFANRAVRQRTPRRVRHRRPDVVRERVVHRVSTRRLGRRVFEALIYAEGGLYIKELVSGDGGDTAPSFASVLGAAAYCAELDVVAVTGGRRAAGSL